MQTLTETEKVTLYFRQGGSDKVYHVAIKPSGTGFVVNVAYARRGGTLQTGTKTNSPVEADALVTELAGKTGGIKAALVVHGSVILGVDLSRARFESVDQKNRGAVLVLPAPRVQSVTLDQEKTRVVALCESGLWIIVPGGSDPDAAVTNAAYREAQRIVARAADDPELIQRSRLQAIAPSARYVAIAPSATVARATTRLFCRCTRSTCA